MSDPSDSVSIISRLFDSADGLVSSQLDIVSDVFEDLLPSSIMEASDVDFMSATGGRVITAEYIKEGIRSYAFHDINAPELRRLVQEPNFVTVLKNADKETQGLFRQFYTQYVTSWGQHIDGDILGRLNQAMHALSRSRAEAFVMSQLQSTNKLSSSMNIPSSQNDWVKKNIKQMKTNAEKIAAPRKYVTQHVNEFYDRIGRKSQLTRPVMSVKEFTDVLKECSEKTQLKFVKICAFAKVWPKKAGNASAIDFFNSAAKQIMSQKNCPQAAKLRTYYRQFHTRFSRHLQVIKAPDKYINKYITNCIIKLKSGQTLQPPNSKYKRLFEEALKLCTPQTRNSFINLCYAQRQFPEQFRVVGAYFQEVCRNTLKLNSMVMHFKQLATYGYQNTKKYSQNYTKISIGAVKKISNYARVKINTSSLNKLGSLGKPLIAGGSKVLSAAGWSSFILAQGPMQDEFNMLEARGMPVPLKIIQAYHNLVMHLEAFQILCSSTLKDRLAVFHQLVQSALMSDQILVTEIFQEAEQKSHKITHDLNEEIVFALERRVLSRKLTTKQNSNPDSMTSRVVQNDFNKNAYLLTLDMLLWETSSKVYDLKAENKQLAELYLDRIETVINELKYHVSEIHKSYEIAMHWLSVENNLELEGREFIPLSEQYKIYRSNQKKFTTQEKALKEHRQSYNEADLLSLEFFKE